MVWIREDRNGALFALFLCAGVQCGGGEPSKIRAASGAKALPPSLDSGPIEDGNDADAPHGVYGFDATSTAGANCLGATVLAALGKTHLVVGLASDPVSSQAPFDAQYLYLSGGLFDGNTPCASCAVGCTGGGVSCAKNSPCGWWGCWQWDQVPPGQYATDFMSKCESAAPAQTPTFTYYELLQAYTQMVKTLPGGARIEGAPEVMAAGQIALMTKYFSDFRFLLRRIGQRTSLLHIEPDFWGYAEQLSMDPHTLPAAVATANPTDCSPIENSIAGLGQCLIAMVRKYAPHALVGLQASAWATNIDVGLNTDPGLDVSGEARKVAAFLSSCGESAADFVVVETGDRDAGYYKAQGRNVSWDPTNATLPNFHQNFGWVKALTEALNKPALYWQVAIGNMAQNNTPNHWQDNRLDYFFAHTAELAAAHAIGTLFGAGSGDQTNASTDGGNLVRKANAYFASGGQPLCP